MLESFSASGFFVHTPCGPRKSGMPESVEMPAPVRTTMRRAAATQLLTSGAKLRHLDLAAAARAAKWRQRSLRHDDLRGGLAAQVLQLLHRALDRFARELAEFVRRFLKRHRRDLEADRQRACGRQHLRLALVDHGPRAVALAVLLYRRQAPDGADAPVGEDLFEEKRVRINLDVVGRLRFGSHVSRGTAPRAASRRGNLARTDRMRRAARSGSRSRRASSLPERCARARKAARARSRRRRWSIPTSQAKV